MLWIEGRNLSSSKLWYHQCTVVLNEYCRCENASTYFLNFSCDKGLNLGHQVWETSKLSTAKLFGNLLFIKNTENIHNFLYIFRFICILFVFFNGILAFEKVDPSNSSVDTWLYDIWQCYITANTVSEELLTINVRRTFKINITSDREKEILLLLYQENKGIGKWQKQCRL